MESEQFLIRFSAKRRLYDLLTPLMSGRLAQEDRITWGIRLLKGERSYVEQDELACMEAVLYTFAMKFLDDLQLKKIKEEMNMTVLGEMILQDGIEKGMKDGIEKGEERILHLNRILIKENRYHDLERATEDRAFCRQLMKELLPEEE